MLTHNWNPRYLGGSLALWLDAADASSITQSANIISQWNDKSGNARHASQATSGNRPTWDSANNAVVFNGSTARLTGSMPTGLTAGSWAIAFDPQGDVAYTILNVSSPSGFEWDRYDTDGFSYPARFRSVRVDAYQSGMPTTGKHILSGISSSSTWQEFLNGSSPGTSAANFSASTTYTVGNNNILTSATWYAGRVHEIVLVSSQLSTQNRQKLEGYLAWKWGTVSSLPTGHPHKTTPPTI